MGSLEGDLDSRRQTLKPVRTKRSAGNGWKHEVFGEVEEEEPLSPIARIFHEPCFNIYVMAIAGCKTRINVDVLKANLGHTLLRHPRFVSSQVKDAKKGGGMKWVPTKVDLDRHIITPELHCAADESPDKVVEDYISDLSKTFIDDSKPLWELHILNIKTSDAESLGVFRIHHSIGDGMSLMSLVLACTRQISNPKALPTLPARKTAAKGKAVKSRGIWWRIKLIWNTIIDVLMFSATLMFLKDTVTPLSYGRKKGGDTGAKRFVHRTISLDDVKLIKNAMNTTINDVVMGVSLAGLSRYLNRKYGEMKDHKEATHKKNNLPKNIRLRAALVMNIRPLPGLHALAEMMEKGSKAKWGNWFGCVLLPFDAVLHDDPLDYIRQTKTTIDRKKHSLEAVVTHFLLSTILKIFGAKVAALVYRRFFKQTTMCFSNVVGPVEEIGFYGHPMEFLAPCVYGQPNGLTVHFQSYINEMTIALSVDEEVIPDPHDLCDDLEESLKLIKDAVIAKGLIKNNSTKWE